MHWPPQDFRRRAHQTIDLIADYWERLQSPAPPWPVLSARKPGETAAMLPASAPEQPEPWDAITADIERIILPGLTHWQSPSFFGYFPANISAPAVLGELLAAGLGVQGMLWATSPACTEVETRVLDWMAQAIGLPDTFLSTSPTGGGVIQGTASEATLVALLAARRRAGHPPRPVVYTSTQAHSSVIKAAMIAGIVQHATPRDGFIGDESSGGGASSGGVRLISTDSSYRMRPEALEAAIRADRAAGRAPIFITATLGTTAAMAVDDLAAIAPLARDHNLWLHIDAAYAGSALICPEHRWMLSNSMPGCLNASMPSSPSTPPLFDSLCFNPHKWLLTNFDCTLFYTSDRASLTSALSITPEYLRNAATDAGAVWDYRDWQIPLGRRFRALKLWLVLRCYGLDGLRAHIREHCRLAELLESLIRADDRFEIPVPRALGLVCFRLRSGNAPSKSLLDAINKDGRLFLSHALLPDGSPHGLYILRMAIGAAFTQEEHIHRAWTTIQNLAP